jgi:hypothetical protein
MASPVRPGTGASTPPETGERGKRSDPGLFEREAQLRLLESLLDDVRGGNGGFAVVEGPAGIGKTALLQAARSMAERSGLSVLSARGTEMERDFAFGIVRQLLEPPLLAAAAEDRASLLSGAAGAAGAVLVPDERNVAPADLGALGPADASFTTLHGLYWLSSNFCDRAPLMFAIDDAHCADPASLRFLRFILPRLAELPLLLLIAVRSEELLGSEALEAILADPLTRQIRLEPLSEAAVRALADAADARLGADAVRACHRATGGNPFLVEELLRDLTARGQLGTPPSAELVRQAPTSVTRSVSLRLAALDEGAGALASATAILGDDVDLRLAAELAGLDLGDASRHADALRTAGLLRSGRRLSFLHPLVRSAVYARISLADRATAHRRSAALLKESGADLTVVALHLLGAEPAGDPGVVEGLREGARMGLARGAPETASRCLRRALAEPPLEGDRARILFELGSACVMAGEPDAAGRLTDALALAGNPTLRAAIALELGAQTLYEGRLAETAQLLKRELETLGGAEPELAAQLESALLITGVTTASARRLVAEGFAEARERLEALPPEQARLLLPCLAVDLAIEGGTADQVAALARRGLEAGPFGIERAGWVLPGDRGSRAGGGRSRERGREGGFGGDRDRA